MKLILALGWLSYLSSIEALLGPQTPEETEKHKALILKSMDQYHKNTCIRFVPRKKWNKHYIKLVKTKECSSNVGRVGGKQVVNLGKYCLYIGIIVHELGHVIGLDHEHERYDRDEYITVYWENIKKGELSNFEKNTPNTVKIPYNYDSIMHYDSYAFSKNPNHLATLWAKNGHKLRAPYRKPGLSKGDIKHINKLYKCKK